MDDTEILAMHGPFRLTKTGAHPTTDDVPYAQWAEATTWVQEVEEASPFWVGDLHLYGERYGEEASQVLKATEYAESTVKNAKHTCKMFPPEKRRASVPYSHHQEIAAVNDEAEREYWLAKCEDENLTRDQLRVQIKAAKSDAAGESVDLWLHVKCTNFAQQQTLADRLRLEGFSVKLSANVSA